MWKFIIALFINILTVTNSQLTNNYCSNYPNPCRNGATCVSIAGGGFRCICTSGFTGNLCDYPSGIIYSNNLFKS